ncbi:beta strand repeat-containing protein [Gemmata obscuriglobus]|uniref:Calx-beta domain-containing protein n=1 Tax=Gemmata obscuriglobus TaxID=114 RepID=A0A2Z3H010_9BACT|nr:FG-GAP repeat protein [Gemmata obscuriglobus]AWM37642.1 hypothetical protein C1280_12010 [Gemmata obscuriglobus]VTS08801.1 na-ca exchanger integrin-beta4 : VCBS OS=Planctomyces maris DSM 8797 GN=PM8797T_03194 PE=3 SV=1: Calx-beta [Gemmata obscuriglobus UQM 2246]
MPNWSKQMFKSQQPTRPVHLAPRLGVEALEDRSVPATVITIQEAAGSLDGFLSATDGTIALNDLAGQAGTLSRAALQGVGAGVAISIAAENAIVFDASLTAPVALQTDGTASAAFVASNGNLAFASAKSLTTSGADLTLTSTNGVLTVANLATSGGNVTLNADAVNVLAGVQVNAGTNPTRSIVTVQPVTNTVNVDLGGAGSAGTIGLTDAELDTITARVLRVGSLTATGTIAVTAPITLAGGAVPTLSLRTGNNTATAVTQTAPLSVTNLAVQSAGTVVLTTPGNDVTTLAASVTGAGNAFRFTDTNALVLGTVDGVAGAATTTAPGSQVTLSAGALTQAAGANVTTSELELLGAGPVTLTNAGNNVATLAASVAGALSYTDADALTVGIVGGTSGVATTNSAIVIATTDGDLSITNGNAGPTPDVNAGTGTVSLTAGGAAGQNRLLAVAIDAGVTGTGGVTLTANDVEIEADVDAGAQLLLVQPFEASTPINLGTNTVGAFALTDAEIDFLITTGAVRIGNAAAGNIDVSAAITVDGASQLELITGGGVMDNNSGAQDISVARLAITAGTGIGVVGTNTPNLELSVTNLEATTATGGIGISNFGELVIGGVTGALSGLSVTTSGAIAITVTGSLTVGATPTEGVSVAGGGNITLTPSNDLAINAPVIASGGNGNITLSARNDITVDATVTVAGTGNITAGADSDNNGGGNFSNTAALTTAGGDITISAQDIELNAAATTTTAASGDIFLLTRDPADVINLGTNTGFGLTNADLNNVTTATLHIGSATNTGGIAVTGQITLGGAVPVLSLETSGAITDATGAEQTDITVASLTLLAGRAGAGGIGATGVGGLDVAVTNLAAANSSPDTGEIVIANASAALNVGTVAGRAGVVNQNTAGGVVLSSTGGIALAATVSGATGVAVSTSGGDLNTTAPVSSSTGAVQLTASGAVSIGGAVSGTGATVTAGTTLTTTAAATVTVGGAGSVALTASAGALSVGASVAAGIGGVTLTATDTAATTNTVTVAAGVSVSTTAATLTINAGDAVTIGGTLTTVAGGTVNVNVDAGAVDVGVGGAVTFSATSNVSGATVMNVTGGADDDTFNLRPLTTGITTNLIAAAGADTLNIDLTAATASAFGNITAVGTGTFSFGNRGSVVATGLESVAATGGTYALNIGLQTAGFQDGNASPDVTTVSNTGSALNVTVQANSTGATQTLFSGRTGDVSTLTVTGSTDRDTVTVDLTNPLPAVTVVGGGPTTIPGDTLNLITTNANGATFTPVVGGGTYTFANRSAVTFSQIEVGPAPVLRVAASDASAAEGATPDTGTFTITRVGDTSAALTVTYTLSGTAVNGVSYQALTGTVTFAPGASTATVTLTPIDNSSVDGTRTAVLTLSPSASYEIAAGASQATIAIADNDALGRRLVVGSSASGTVQVLDNSSNTAVASFRPYAGYQGGVSVAVGDVTGDGVADIVTGATALSPHVKVFDGVTFKEIRSFFAFTNFASGVSVAVGDLDNDGKSEIIVGAGTLAPHVKVFDATTLQERASFYAFTLTTGAPIASGITVAAGDTDGDGRAEIVVGATVAPHVKTFDLAGNTLRSFLVPNLPPDTGISVGTGDLDGDKRAELLVGARVGGQAVTTVFQGEAAIGQFSSGAVATTPRVAGTDRDGDGKDELILTLGPTVSVRSGTFPFDQLSTLTPFTGFNGGVFVG